MKVVHKLILLFLIGLARQAQSTRASLQCLCDKEKEIRNETALAGSNTALTIYYTFNVFPPLNLFLSQYGIHTKPFLNLINYLCNISLLLLFQVTVAPCKLACFSSNSVMIGWPITSRFRFFILLYLFFI